MRNTILSVILVCVLMISSVVPYAAAGTFLAESTVSEDEKYAAVSALHFDAFVFFLTGTEGSGELRSADYSGDADAYLCGTGM